MLERGGCVVVEGPLDDPLAQALATALAAPDPAICVLRLDRALWPNGAPGGRPAPPMTPAAMVCRGQTCGLPVRDMEALRRNWCARPSQRREFDRRAHCRAACRDLSETLWRVS